MGHVALRNRCKPLRARTNTTRRSRFELQNSKEEETEFGSFQTSVQHQRNNDASTSTQQQFLHPVHSRRTLTLTLAFMSGAESR